MDTIDKIKELIASLQAEIDEWETDGSLDDAREVPPTDKRSEEEKAEDTEREMNEGESEDKEPAESPQEKAAEAAEEKAEGQDKEDKKESPDKPEKPALDSVPKEDAVGEFKRDTFQVKMINKIEATEQAARQAARK
jgi:hypothetical protein|nr:MAG TPA: hypothetical protein [Caudoviricetes sp.]